ncbi:MAG: flagellar hook-length control protein FliK [Lachnospiraceae bacterium]|nr:flagellar hook-length control protein FliK [Lachnospiraceae bacterium]MDY5521948.1 flagellar hook-length control protein FliK [Agathobacter sp.]
MNISTLVGQYNQATAAGSEKITGTKGVENLVSSLKSLTKGNIFEGTVSSMKNGRVTLALAGGSQISARVDGKVSLSVGQSMFFQVKSNDGTQIAIRPFVVDGNGVNYTLMQALSAAGLPTQSNYLSMVNRMMQEQMPIDKNSLQQMARLVNANGTIDVQTLVQMNKLGIAITPENAAQFENYLGDRQAITAAIDDLINELPTAMQGTAMPEGELRQMNAQVLSIVTENIPDVLGGAAQAGAAQAEVLQAEAVQAENPLLAAAEAAQQGIPWPHEEAVVTEDALGQNAEAVKQEDAAVPGTQADNAVLQEKETVPPAEHSLEAVLGKEQLTNLNALLGKLTGQEKAGYTFQQSAVSVLKDLQQLLQSDFPVNREHLQKLLDSDAFKSLVKDALEQQWTIKPEELTGSNQINKLYEKLDNQMNRMADVLKATGQESTNFQQMAADIRSNVDFMNQINEAYTYVQIPLKMSGQNASGELYVYTNKKALAEGNKELTAFLHLDMEHLGPTDVSVRMRGKEVSTNFYLENDEAYDLLEQHLPVLEEKLKSKGYNCKISVTNEAKHVNFVEDFLKKDQPSAGQLHRYSFDMRA